MYNILVQKVARVLSGLDGNHRRASLRSKCVYVLRGVCSLLVLHMAYVQSNPNPTRRRGRRRVEQAGGRMGWRPVGCDDEGEDTLCSKFTRRTVRQAGRL